MPPLPNINLILSSLLSASEIHLAALNMYGKGEKKNIRRTMVKNEMTRCDLSLISTALQRRHGDRLMKCSDKIKEGNLFIIEIWQVKLDGINTINVFLKD